MKKQCVLLSLVLLAAGLFTMGCTTYGIAINVDPEFKDYVSASAMFIDNPADLSLALKKNGGTGEIRTLLIGTNNLTGLPSAMVYGPKDPNYIPTIIFYESTVKLTDDERAVKEKEFGITEFVRVTTRTDSNQVIHYYYHGRIVPDSTPETPAE